MRNPERRRQGRADVGPLPPRKGEEKKREPEARRQGRADETPITRAKQSKQRPGFFHRKFDDAFGSMFGMTSRWDKEEAYLKSLSPEDITKEADEERAAVGISKKENTRDTAKKRKKKRKTNVVQLDGRRQKPATSPDAPSEPDSTASADNDSETSTQQAPEETHDTRETIPKTDIDHVIEAYLSYADADFPKDRKQTNVQKTMEDEAARSYAEHLIRLEKKHGSEKILTAGHALRDMCVEYLEDKKIPLSPVAKSQSWALWEMGEQWYYADDPKGKEAAQTLPDYNPGDPIENPQLQKEILERHVGFEVLVWWAAIVDASTADAPTDDASYVLKRQLDLSDEQNAELDALLTSIAGEKTDEGEIPIPPAHVLKTLGEILLRDELPEDAFEQEEAQNEEITPEEPNNTSELISESEPDATARYTYRRDSMKTITTKDGPFQKAGAEVLEPEMVTKDFDVGDHITFFDDGKERKGIWNGSHIKDITTDLPWGVLGILMSPKSWIRNDSKIEAANESESTDTQDEEEAIDQQSHEALVDDDFEEPSSAPELIAETTPQQKKRAAKIETAVEEEKEIDHIVTAKGSVYTYLPDGTTQRYKKVENKDYEPQSALVFIPDYETLKNSAPDSFKIEETLGENELQYMQILLGYLHIQGQTFIMNEKKEAIYTNDDVQKADRVYLAFVNGTHDDFAIPVSKKPKVGFSTYDTRVYTNEEGNERVERHIGNKVVEIVYKD